MTIQDAMVFWNPWWSETKGWLDATQREALPLLQKYLKRKEILTITGVRRSGKTTLLYLLIQSLLDTGISAKQILHINLEDPIFKDMTLSEIYHAYRDLINLSGPAYLFFDEIQEMDNWQQDLRKLYDGFDKLNITITGSNSSLLKGEYAQLLTGRTLIYENYPFSFREFVASKGFLAGFEKHLLLREKSKIINLFREYMTFGGFPEVMKEHDEKLKLLLLKDYYTGIVTRDILRRYPIRQVKKYEKAAHYFMSSFTDLFSAKSLSGILNINMHTLEEYLEFLEAAYLMFPVNHFSYSLKRQITYPRKIYCVDNGIINAVSFRFSENTGKQLENIVFSEIKRSGIECYYWKGKKECDFLLKDREKTVDAVQVTFSMKQHAVRKREIEGLLEALKAFDLAQGIILTYDEFDRIDVDGRTIEVQPAWYWMLVR